MRHPLPVSIEHSPKTRSLSETAAGFPGKETKDRRDSPYPAQLSERGRKKPVIMTGFFAFSCLAPQSECLGFPLSGYSMSKKTW